MNSKQLAVGQHVTARRTFSQADFDRFAALSGDVNPIHVDPEFSAKTKFGRTVCHGMLLYSTICKVLGDKLPGPGAVQLEQALMFPTPTFTGEEMTIDVEVNEVRPGDGVAILETTISHADGRIACQGQSAVSQDVRLLSQGRNVNKQTRPSEAKTFKGLSIGQTAVTRRTFTDRVLAEYRDLTGDHNPLFGDAAYAQQAGLKQVMIPGGLLGGLFSYLLGTELPGRGTNWLKQQLAFIQPSYPGEEITAQVQIIRLRPEKELVNLRSKCLNPAGQVVCTGEALVLVSDLITIS
ncbi:MAG TPA: MaoC family dehydratase [Anaerolineae bacterium]|nr:MaoC family dehydratase [Anaerolineae bacterium]